MKAKIKNIITLLSGFSHKKSNSHIIKQFHNCNGGAFCDKSLNHLLLANVHIPFYVNWLVCVALALVTPVTKYRYELDSNWQSISLLCKIPTTLLLEHYILFEGV